MINNSINTRNYLRTDRYMISHNLHSSLNTGIIQDDNKDAFYLVMFRVKSYKDKCLVYKYIKYPYMFFETLIYFITTRNRLFGNSYKEPGNLFCLLDNVMVTNKLSDKLSITKHILGCNNILNKTPSEYYPITREIIFEIINKLVMFTNIDNMSILLELAYNKKYNEFVKVVFSDEDYKTTINTLNEEKDAKCINIVNSCLFITKDLKYLIKVTRDKGYNVNAGTQASRGEINSISSSLSMLDNEYRKSLYNHITYHINRGNIDSWAKISRDKFSFNNIHMNLGGVRLYSTYINKRIISVSPNNLTCYVNVKFISSKSISNRNELLQTCFQEISNIIDEKNVLPLQELQLKIENVLFEGESWYNNKHKTNIRYNESTYEYITGAKSKLITVLSNTNYYNGYKKIYGTEYIHWFNIILSSLKPELVSDILIGYFLHIVTNESIKIDDALTPGIPSITCYNNCGKKILLRYLYLKYLDAKNNLNEVDRAKYTYIDFKNSDPEIKIISDDINFNARIGGYFVYALIDIDLIRLHIGTKNDESYKQQEYVRLSPESRDIMVVKEEQNIFHVPSKLPMICPPKKYSFSNNGINDGGYLLNGEKYSNDIFINKIGYGKPTVIKDKNIIIDLINGLSRTPYKVNTDTLDFINKYGVDKGIIIDRQNRDIIDIINNPYKSNTKKVSRENRSLVSKFYQQENIINIAQLYSSVDEIFFPVRIDQRTRIYCITDYFDYQKNDLARGLISFAKAGKLSKTDKDIIKYFKAFGANMYGNGLDKKSINHRVDWVDNNSDRILEFETNDIVNKSENKTCFVSFCFEYKRFIKYIANNESKIFYTYLPIQLDASCNGYQHLTLLTREKKLFDVLNLAQSTHDDDPDDFYSYILELTIAYIKVQIDALSSADKLTDKDLSLKSSYEKLMLIDFDRSMVKKTIMTKSYSASVPTQVAHLITLLNEVQEGKNKYYTHLSNPKIKLVRGDIVAFVMVIKTVIAKESPRITELSKYLDAIVSICTKLDFPVPWVLPSGAEIRESYEKEKTERFKAFFFVNTKYTFKSYQRGLYDLRKQKRATMPNLIHSLDATTIAILFKNFKNIGPMYTIHDCFGVSANNVPRLILKLKLAYIQLYSSTGYLKEFDEFVKTSINKTFKDDVYKLNDDYIYLPNKKRSNKVPMPNINKVLNNSVDVSSLNKSANIII